MCSILFCLANLYVSAEVAKPTPFNWRSMEGPWCEGHPCRGSQAQLELGMRVEVRNWQIDYGFKHESFIEENDHGFNVPFVKLEWRPFK